MTIQQITNLPPGFWSQLARGSNQSINYWVKEDCKQGIMQNGTSNHQYSEQYARYKANDMRRFTSGKPRKKTGKGDRLKSYEGLGGLKGISLDSTDVSKVTMILTGLTTNALKEKTHTSNSLTMVFEGVNSKLLTGNRDRGYDIIGLNDKNRDKVKQKLLNEFKKNVAKLPKKIEIDLR